LDNSSQVQLALYKGQEFNTSQLGTCAQSGKGYNEEY
jgi:hypothetical protein